MYTGLVACDHNWHRIAKAGFNMKQCQVCKFYQGAVYIPQRKLLTNSNRKDLEDVLMELKTQHNKGTLGVGSVQKHSKRFHAILDGYLDEWVSQPGRNTATIRSQIKLFKEEMPNPTLHAMNEPTDPAYNIIGKWVKTFLKRAKPASAKRKFTTLRAALNWGIAKGYLSQNPCKRVELPEVADPLPRFLEEREIEALFRASSKPRFHKYCSLILQTGLRPGEALGLNVTHIDLKRMVISGFVQKNKKKLGSVPILESLVPLLVELIGGRTEGSLLNYTQQMLRDDSEEAIAASNINDIIKPGTTAFTIYGLRHTFASHLLMRGESMTTVARWLRNSVAICDKYYGHLTQDYLRDRANEMNLVPRFLPVINQSLEPSFIGEK